jgi:hypothetical protein
LGFFDGSEVFRRVSAAEEVSGGGSWSTRVTAPPNAGLDVGFCFRVFMFFSSVFIVCLCDA